MSREYTRNEVKSAIETCCRRLSKSISSDDIEFIIERLAGRMTGHEIVSALDMIVESGTNPSLASILEFEKGGFPKAHEALAIAISLHDETRTVLINDCITQAWSVAEPLIRSGNTFAGNKAFEERYNRAISELKIDGHRKPKWFISAGTDKEAREKCIRESAEAGLIELSKARGLLPHLTDEEIINPLLKIESKTVNKLLESPNNHHQSSKGYSQCQINKLKDEYFGGGVEKKKVVASEISGANWSDSRGNKFLD